MGCIVRQFLVYTHEMSVHHSICLLNWIKISLESMFLSFIIISQEMESYQTVAGACRPQGSCPR